VMIEDSMSEAAGAEGETEKVEKTASPEGTASPDNTANPEGAAAGNGAADNGVTGGVTAAPVQLPETLPGGMKPNVTNVSGTNTATQTDTNKTKTSESLTETEAVTDWGKVNKAMEEWKKNAPSAAKVVLDLFGDSISPEKVAAEKADADRRRRRHEGVEAIRLMIEAATGAAHGRIIKRDKANYARYEAEKDKMDATRKAALEKLYAAMAADDKAASDMKMKLMQIYTTQRQKAAKTENEQGGSITKGQTNTANLGHQQPTKGVTVNTGDNRKDWRTVSIPVQMKNEKGTYKLTEKVVKLPGGEQAYNSMLNNVGNILTEDNNTKSVNGRKSLWDMTKEKFSQSGYNLTDPQMRQVITNGRYEIEDSLNGAKWVDASKLREQIIVSMAGATRRTRAAVTAAGGEWTDLDESSMIQEAENSVSGDQPRILDESKKGGSGKKSGSGKKGTAGMYGK